MAGAALELYSGDFEDDRQSADLLGYRLGGSHIVVGWCGLLRRGALMNIKEFGALKLGDKIENPSTGGIGMGEVVETTDSGVRVVWGDRHERETKFFYSVVGTSWMNWILVRPADKV